MPNLIFFFSSPLKSLLLSVPPRWILEPQDQSAVLGNSVTIQCKADGFPIPNLHWKQAIGINTFISFVIIIN